MDNISINLDLLTKCDETISNEILKNLQCDIQDLINENYQNCIDNIEINGKIRYNTIFKVGDTIKTKQTITEDWGKLEEGTVGTVININYKDKYPIECEFDVLDYDVCCFLPEELELKN